MLDLYRRGAGVPVGLAILVQDRALDCQSAAAAQRVTASEAMALGHPAQPGVAIGRIGRPDEAGESMVAVSVPLPLEGAQGGRIVMAAPVSSLGEPLVPPGVSAPLGLALVDGQGVVLHLWAGGLTADLLADAPQPVAGSNGATGADMRRLADRIARGGGLIPGLDPAMIAAGSVGHRTGSDGRRLVLVSADLIPGKLRAVAAWPAEMAPASDSAGQFLRAIIFPALMWAISLIVAYVAVYRMVVRHIRHMNGAMRRFALGQREGPALMPPPQGAPAEIREFVATLGRMSRLIAQASWRDMVRCARIVSTICVSIRSTGLSVIIGS